jgi:hypothetical protein
MRRGFFYVQRMRSIKAYWNCVFSYGSNDSFANQEGNSLMRRLVGVFGPASIALAACVSSPFKPFRVTPQTQGVFESQLAADILRIDPRRHVPLRALAPDYRITTATLGPSNITADQTSESSRYCLYLDLQSEGSGISHSALLTIYIIVSKHETNEMFFFNKFIEAGNNSSCATNRVGAPFPALNGQILKRGPGLGL